MYVCTCVTQLSGSLPSSVQFWEGLQSLRVLNVDDNQFSGTIPSAIALVGSGGFVSLELSDNRLSGVPTLLLPVVRRCLGWGVTESSVGAAGTLPTELALLPTGILSVYGNANLTGEVPPGVNLSVKWFSRRYDARHLLLIALYVGHAPIPLMWLTWLGAVRLTGEERVPQVLDGRTHDRHRWHQPHCNTAMGVAGGSRPPLQLLYGSCVLCNLTRLSSQLQPPSNQHARRAGSSPLDPQQHVAWPGSCCSGARGLGAGGRGATGCGPRVQNALESLRRQPARGPRAQLARPCARARAGARC